MYRECCYQGQKPKLVRLPVTVLVKLSLATQQVMREASSTAATTDAEIYLGGIVGYLTEKGEVSYCSNTAAIEGTAGCVGGVGIIMRDANNAPAVAYCTNKANVVLQQANHRLEVWSVQ